MSLDHKKVETEREKQREGVSDTRACGTCPNFSLTWQKWKEKWLRDTRWKPVPLLKKRSNLSVGLEMSFFISKAEIKITVVSITLWNSAKCCLLIATFVLKFPKAHMPLVLWQVYLHILSSDRCLWGLFSDELAPSSWSITRSTVPSPLCDLSCFDPLHHKHTHFPLRADLSATSPRGWGSNPGGPVSPTLLC